MAIYQEGTKIHIVFNKSFLRWPVYSLLVLMILGYLYLDRKEKVEALETIYKAHFASSRNLGRNLRNFSNIRDYTVFLDRLRRGEKLLRNKNFDDEVLIVECLLIEAGSHWPTISMEFVDEKLRAGFVKYINEESQPEKIEFTFACPNEMPPPEFRMFGTTAMLLSLIKDPNLPKDTQPYQFEKEGRWYFNCPEPFYDSIMDRQGSFVLLDQDGNILDRVNFKDLCVVEERQIQDESPGL